MTNKFLSLASSWFNRIQSHFPPCLDKFFTQAKYLLLFGKTVNWHQPVTYTEKLNIHKISSQAEKLWRYVDKYKVRNWIAKKIGKKYLVPLISIYKNTEAINFNQLPRQFVIKANHGSGWILMCRDKNKFDWPAAKEKLNYWLKTNYYKKHKERQYKLVKPRIVIEKYLQDKYGDAYDYKFFCFDGQPKLIQVDLDRYISHTQNFYTPSWKKIPMARIFPVFKKELPKPKTLPLMLEIAKKLSSGFPHVRVDLYDVHGKIYFGEMTFTSYGGFSPFTPEKYERLLGRWFKLGLEYRRQ